MDDIGYGDRDEWRIAWGGVEGGGVKTSGWMMSMMTRWLLFGGEEC